MLSHEILIGLVKGGVSEVTFRADDQKHYGVWEKTSVERRACGSKDR